MANTKPKEVIEVRYVGLREVRTSRRCRWAPAWAIFVDGRELQPWMSERGARELAKAMQEEEVVFPRSPKCFRSVQDPDRPRSALPWIYFETDAPKKGEEKKG